MTIDMEPTSPLGGKTTANDKKNGFDKETSNNSGKTNTPEKYSKETSNMCDEDQEQEPSSDDSHTSEINIQEDLDHVSSYKIIKSFKKSIDSRILISDVCESSEDGS